MNPRLARLVPRLGRPDRYQVAQSLKAAAAASLAWAITGWWLAAPMALMAPWAAVALVQGTVYRSVRTGAQLLLMITTGTVLAAVAAVLTGNTMVAMVIVLPLTVLLGNWAPVGGQGLYAPTTALFVLAYGSYSLPDVGHRLLETAVGAAVGIAVNALVLPPVHSRHVKRLACGLPRDCAALLRELGKGVTDHDEEQAERWHGNASDLLGAVSELRVARAWASESYRLNPGHRLRRRTPAPPEAWDSVWARVSNRLLALTLTLWETASDHRRLPRPPDATLEALGVLLTAAAEICSVDEKIMEEGATEERAAIRDAHLEDAHRALELMKEPLHGPEPDRRASAGSLVAGCQALLDELAVDADGMPLPAGRPEGEEDAAVAFADGSGRSGGAPR
ncbi:FUSC family protein [Streptomyces pratensis]|uniref:FUSC family protein n=1 Tax=Streptomyces pratensis TaxID=1169025 RepID=UPI00301728F4